MPIRSMVRRAALVVGAGLAVTVCAPASFAGENGAPDPCACIWHNGDPSTAPTGDPDGLISHEGGAITDGVKSADDFSLCEGYVYRLRSISADFITTSMQSFAKARLELYADCDGAPGELLYSFNRSTFTDVGVAPSGARLVRYTFNADDQNIPSGVANVPSAPISLRAGTYWVSVVGLTDGQCPPPMNMCDQSAWRSADGPVKGRPAHKIVGVPTGMWNTFSYADQQWVPADECCAGCIDLSFTVCADKCKILIDQGGPDLSRISAAISGGLSAVDARTADDFVIPPCEPRELCYVAGYILTNCNQPRARLDVYDPDCRLPSVFSPPITFPASRLTDTGETRVVDGKTMRLYFVEFWNFNFFGEPLTLLPGQNYWLAPYAVGGGGISDRGYVAGAKRCDRPDCQGVGGIGNPAPRTAINFNPAAVSGNGFGITDGRWETISEFGGQSYDLGLVVAVRDIVTRMQPQPGTSGCDADFNRDGAATTQDLFDYLASYFAGCP